MSQRFDVFRKENEHFIKWVGTAEHLDDVGKLIREDSESANVSEDAYVVVHSSYGFTDNEGPVFESHLTLHP